MTYGLSGHSLYLIDLTPLPRFYSDSSTLCIIYHPHPAWLTVSPVSIVSDWSYSLCSVYRITGQYCLIDLTHPVGLTESLVSIVWLILLTLHTLSRHWSVLHGWAYSPCLGHRSVLCLINLTHLAWFKASLVWLTLLTLKAYKLPDQYCVWLTLLTQAA